jgi:hemerythrin-like domain-containing protein
MGRARTMDALRLLKEDHVKVKKMLSELEGTTERAAKTREAVFSQLKDELEVHEAIEEEFLYPALKNQPKTRDIAFEAYEEHHVVDEVVGEMLDLPVSDETWTAKFTVMKENLEHHIQEEEDDMFEKARRALGDEELADLGERMAARRDALEATR